jgi:clan AA aspartic protease
MIISAVDARLEASIPLEVFGPQGQQQAITAVIDTGYNGALTLPSAVIRKLSLPPLVAGPVTLADDSQRTLSFFSADVLWDGRMRKIRVLCLEVDSLVGTALLRGCRVEAEFVDGGAIAISPVL